MTDAEKRDASLRVVELPDCCGNCRAWKRGRCFISERPVYQHIRADKREFNNHCDLHERRTNDT